MNKRKPKNRNFSCSLSVKALISVSSNVVMQVWNNNNKKPRNTVPCIWYILSKLIRKTAFITIISMAASWAATIIVEKHCPYRPLFFLQRSISPELRAPTKSSVSELSKLVQRRIPEKKLNFFQAYTLFVLLCLA